MKITEAETKAKLPESKHHTEISSIDMQEVKREKLHRGVEQLELAELRRDVQKTAVLKFGLIP